MLFAGFCLSFGVWLVFVRSAHRIAGSLPMWFRRVEVTSGH
jgi:hypothetical protein